MKTSLSESAPWVSELRVDGALKFRLRRDGAQLVAEWSGLAELTCDRNGEMISFRAFPGADSRALAKLRAGAAAALVRHLRGEMSLHASAIAKDGVAILCLGPSGAGKSSTAADLCMRAGWALLADDIVAIDISESAIMVCPSETEHWLDAAARDALGLGKRPEEKDKEPIPPWLLAQSPARLAAIVSLEFNDGLDIPRVHRLRGRAALAPLVSSVARFVLDEPEVHLREFAQLSSLCNRAPVYEVQRPCRLAELQSSSDAIAKLGGENGYR